MKHILMACAMLVAAMAAACAEETACDAQSPCGGGGDRAPSEPERQDEH